MFFIEFALYFIGFICLIVGGSFCYKKLHNYNILKKMHLKDVCSNHILISKKYYNLIYIVALYLFLSFIVILFIFGYFELHVEDSTVKFEYSDFGYFIFGYIAIICSFIYLLKNPNEILYFIDMEPKNNILNNFLNNLDIFMLNLCYYFEKCFNFLLTPFMGMYNFLKSLTDKLHIFIVFW